MASYFPSLQQAGFAKAVVTAPHRIRGLRSQDEMIRQLDIDGQRRLPQAPGYLEIGRTRRRIATGVVVLCCVPSYVE